MRIFLLILFLLVFKIALAAENIEITENEKNRIIEENRVQINNWFQNEGSPDNFQIYRDNIEIMYKNAKKK